MRFVVRRAVAHATSVAAGRRIVTRAMREVLALARPMVVGSYSTGHLASRLTHRGPFVTSSAVTGRVGVWGVRYAAAVEEGARRHYIFPRGPWKLKFFWRKIGEVVVFDHVHHPGQKAKHYLTVPLKQVARRNHMRVVIKRR